jgi:hypothetical protein
MTAQEKLTLTQLRGEVIRLMDAIARKRAALGAVSVQSFGYNPATSDQTPAVQRQLEGIVALEAELAGVQADVRRLLGIQSRNDVGRALWLYWGEGVTGREVARILGCSLSWAQKLFSLEG